jgi:hypothetical protein
VKGTVETAQVTGGCDSPVGLCFEGVLRTNGPLRGETFFTAETVTPVEGAPALLRYTGTLRVTLPGGREVLLASAGEVDTATGAFVETDVATDGPLAGTALTFTGTALPGLTGFRGGLTGALCGVPPAPVDVPHGPRR